MFLTICRIGVKSIYIPGYPENVFYGRILRVWVDGNIAPTSSFLTTK